jgi:DNA primase (bacterial type)
MYDIKEIKAIPIVDVAQKYGIELVNKHGRLWGKLRDEKTASFSINIAKNLWYDFGAGKGGSVIDLVAEIEGISPTEAINKLAEEYSLKNEVSRGWHPLTDSQYREIGLEAERATMNFNFDLRIHTPEQLSRWSEKYGMPLRELAEKIPDTYNKLVNKIGQEHISAIRDSYFTKIRLAVDPNSNSSQREVYKKWAELDSAVINAKVDLLTRAIKDNTKLLSTVQSLKVNIDNDLRNYDTQRNNEQKKLSEDEIIRDKIVKVYKKLYNFQQADYLTVDAAKALLSLNSAVSNSEIKFLAIQEIKELYKMLGNKLQKVEASYSHAMKEGEMIHERNSIQYTEWKTKTESLRQDIQNVKEMFNKCSSAVEGLREASLAYKSEISKQNAAGRSPQKSINLDR